MSSGSFGHDGCISDKVTKRKDGKSVNPNKNPGGLPVNNKKKSMGDGSFDDNNEQEGEEEEEVEEEEGLRQEVHPRTKTKLIYRRDGTSYILRPDPKDKRIFSENGTSTCLGRTISHSLWTCDVAHPTVRQERNNGLPLSDAIFDSSITNLAVPCPVIKFFTTTHPLHKPIVISWASPMAPPGQAMNPSSFFRSLFVKAQSESDSTPLAFQDYVQDHNLAHYLDDLGYKDEKNIVPYFITAQTHYGPDLCAEFVMDISTPKAAPYGIQGSSSSSSSLLKTSGSFASPPSSSDAMAERLRSSINWINNKPGTTTFYTQRSSGGQSTWQQDPRRTKASHSYPYLDASLGEQTVYTITGDSDFVEHADFSRFMALRPDEIYRDLQNLEEKQENRPGRMNVPRTSTSANQVIRVVHAPIQHGAQSVSVAVWFWLAYGRPQCLLDIDESNFQDKATKKAELYRDWATSDDKQAGIHRLLIYTDYLRYQLGKFMEAYDPSYHIMPVGPISLRLRTQNPVCAQYLYDNASATQAKPLAWRTTIRIYFDILPSHVRNPAKDSTFVNEMIGWATAHANAITPADDDF